MVTRYRGGYVPNVETLIVPMFGAPGATRLCLCDAFASWYVTDDGLGVCECGHPDSEHIAKRGSCTGEVFA